MLRKFSEMMKELTVIAHLNLLLYWFNTLNVVFYFESFCSLSTTGDIILDKGGTHFGAIIFLSKQQGEQRCRM